MDWSRWLNRRTIVAAVLILILAVPAYIAGSEQSTELAIGCGLFSGVIVIAYLGFETVKEPSPTLAFVGIWAIFLGMVIMVVRHMHLYGLIPENSGIAVFLLYLGYFIPYTILIVIGIRFTPVIEASRGSSK